MKKGKLIVIDGIDGAGKATQTRLLVKRLRAAKVKAEPYFIPHYEGFFGNLIARYLLNEFGRISPYLAAVLYAANRYELKHKILSALKSGKIVVMNRYVTANQLHQASEIESRSERKKFVDWVGEMEYKIFGMPKPDLILFLRVEPSTAITMIQSKSRKERRYAKGAKMDILESDFAHQSKALEQINHLLKIYTRKAKVIESMDKGHLLPPKEIHEKIWQVVSRMVK